MNSKEITFEEAVKISRNYQMAYYIVAASKLGISYEMIIHALVVEFKKDGKKWRIHKSLTPINDSVAMTLATYKNVCNRFLGKNEIPVPKQISAERPEDILEFLKEVGHNKIVIKPKRGFGGAGITILPEDEGEIRDAFKLAEDKCLKVSGSKKKVIAEEFIAGENYRLLVLGDQVIGAAHRKSAEVTGDGKSAIQVLIDTKNSSLKSKKRPTIPVDRETFQTLDTQNLSLDSIPSKGQKVKLRFNCNLSTGGSTRECLNEIHQSYKDIAVKASQIIGLKLSGVDIITPDISKPSDSFAINEINHDPGLRIHYMPDEGEVTDVALPIQQYIFDNI